MVRVVAIGPVGDQDVALTYAEEELVVESVAFTVCRGLGLDPSGASIPYLACWSEAAELATIERTAALIDRMAGRMEAVLEDHEEGRPWGAQRANGRALQG